MTRKKKIKIMKRLHSYFKDGANSRRAIPVALFIIIFGGLGVYLLTGSHAATPFANVTASGGTMANGAATQTDSTASNGSMVAFNGVSSGGGGGGGGSTQTSNCFPSPGACGLPDPNYAWSASANAWVTDTSVNSTTGAVTIGGGGVGPTNTAGTQSVPCSSLTPSGSATVSSSSPSVQSLNLNISGTLDITASNVTVKNVCVSVNGGDSYGGPPAVSVEGTNDIIEDSTFGGANDTTQATQQAISDPNGTATLDHDSLQNCSECIHTGLTINDSYVLTTTATVNGDDGPDHYEDVFIWGNTIVANHDTMFDPMSNTAVIFGNASGSCQNHVTLTGSLIAGGDYTLQPCSNQSPAGGGSMTITGNRIARCLSKSCPDSHGYYPNGGSYNYDTSGYINCSGANNKWSGNVWDDNSATISC